MTDGATPAAAAPDPRLTSVEAAIAGGDMPRAVHLA